MTMLSKKGLMGAIGATVLGVALVGCGTQQAGAPTPTVTVTAQAQPTTEAPTPTPTPTLDSDVTSLTEQAYLEAIHTDLADSVVGVPDSLLLELGHNVCAAMDSGVPVLTVLQSGVDAGVAPYDAGYIVGAAVAAFCPQNLPALEEFIEQYGGVES